MTKKDNRKVMHVQREESGKQDTKRVANNPPSPKKQSFYNAGG